MLRVTLALALLAAPQAASADVVSYEGDVFPEDQGWERLGTFDADRWLVDGWLVQEVDLGVWDPLPGGEQDYYRGLIPQFAGAPFFIEWRVVTDAPRTEIDGVGGSALAVAGGSVMYHFTIAADQVRLVRGVPFDNIWVDIEPQVEHTYRLEVNRNVNFEWFIDGELIISEIPEDDFPTADARITWGASMWLTPSRNEWDYVRFGTIPEPATFLLLLGGAGLVLRRRTKRHS